MKTMRILFFTALVLLWVVPSQAQDKIVKLTELPQVAQDFVKNNFDDMEISYIKQESKLGFIKEYELKFLNGDEIEFDNKGNWKEVDMKRSEVPSGIVLDPILSYVSTNFSETKILKIKRKTRYYEVKLSNGLELEFTKGGEFIRIDD